LSEVNRLFDFKEQKRQNPMFWSYKDTRAVVGNRTSLHNGENHTWYAIPNIAVLGR